MPDPSVDYLSDDKPNRECWLFDVPKSALLYVRLDEHQFERLHALAYRDRVRLEHVVREAVDEYIGRRIEDLRPALLDRR